MQHIHSAVLHHVRLTDVNRRRISVQGCSTGVIFCIEFVVSPVVVPACAGVVNTSNMRYMVFPNKSGIIVIHGISSHSGPIFVIR